jgi:hypothetical protein
VGKRKAGKLLWLSGERNISSNKEHIKNINPKKHNTIHIHTAPCQTPLRQDRFSHDEL